MYPSPTSSPVAACTVYWKTEPLFQSTSDLPPHPINSRIGSSTSRLAAPATPKTPITTTKRSTTTAKLPSPSSHRAAVADNSNLGRDAGSMRRSKKKRRAESVVPGASQEKVDEGTMRTLGALAKRLTRREGSTASLVGAGGQVLGANGRADALKDTTRANGNRLAGDPLSTGKGKEKALDSKSRTNLVNAAPILPISLPSSKSSLRSNAPTTSSKLTTSSLTSTIPKTTWTLGTSSTSETPTTSKAPSTNDDEFDTYFPAAEDEGAFELALSQAEEKLSSSQAQAQAQKQGPSRVKAAPLPQMAIRTSPKKPLPISKPAVRRSAFARPAPAPVPNTTITTTMVTKPAAKPTSTTAPPQPMKKAIAPRHSQEDKKALLKKELEALAELNVAEWSDGDDF